MKLIYNISCVRRRRCLVALQPHGANSIKLLLLEAFSDRGHNEGLENGFENILIPLHGHEMATGLVTSVDRCSCRKSRKV
jgi:hypothetical protein